MRQVGQARDGDCAVLQRVEDAVFEVSRRLSVAESREDMVDVAVVAVAGFWIGLRVHAWPPWSGR
jgi:hypothetical protein